MAAQSLLSRKGWAVGFLIGALFNVGLYAFRSHLSTNREIRALNNLDEYEEEDLEFDALFVTCIVMGLIGLTIAFEEAKHFLENSVTEDMEPIIEKLFGEMTVLGFLSMISFLLNACGFFHFLSRRIVGNESEHEELLEVFEWVHFAIFFIMVFFFVQVVVLIRQALRTEEQWLELDKDYRLPESERAKNESSEGRDMVHKLWKRLRHSNAYISLLPFFRSSKNELEVDRAYFKALRDEFILDRSMEPPFAPTPESQRLKYDFVFGRYLGLCLVRFLARVVDVTNSTLILLAFWTVLFYLWSRVVNENVFVLSWTWLAIEWFSFLFNVFFEQHILHVRKRLVPESSPHLISLYNKKLVVEDKTSFTAMSEDDLSLPAWCSVNMTKYMRERSIFKKVFVGGKPNRQNTLYWMDRHGTRLYLVLLQSNMIFIGIDCALQLDFFLPTMIHECSTPVLAVYVTLSLMAISGNMLNKRHLVASLSTICCLGTHRNIKAIADVFREEKTEKLVRCLLIVYRLHKFAYDVKSAPIPISHDDDDHYTKKLDQLEIIEVSKTFECFAQQDDAIRISEFKEMMITLGGNITEETLTNMINTMDVDSNGSVEKEEFLQWYSDNMVGEQDDNALHNAPRELFRLFDQDDHGELSISVFKSKLDALKTGFSVDEQIAIINEIDKNGSGSITEHEFQLLFKKFPPHELLRRKRRFEYRPGDCFTCEPVMCHTIV